MLSFIFTSVRSSSSWFTVAVCSLQHGSGLGSLSPLCWVCGIAQQLCRAEGVVLLLKRFQIKPQNSTPAAYTRNIYRTLNPLLAGLCWSNTHSPVLVLSFLWQWWHNQQSTADVKQFLLITDKFLLIKPSWVSSSSSGAQLQWVFLMQPILGASTLRPTAQSHFFREVADCSQHAKPGKKAGPTSALDLSKQVCMYTYLNCFAFMAPFVLMTQCVMKSYSGLVWCADHWLPQGNAATTTTSQMCWAYGQWNCMVLKPLGWTNSERTVGLHPTEGGGRRSTICEGNAAGEKQFGCFCGRDTHLNVISRSWDGDVMKTSACSEGSQVQPWMCFISLSFPQILPLFLWSLRSSFSAVTHFLA